MSDESDSETRDGSGAYDDPRGGGLSEQAALLRMRAATLGTSAAPTQLDRYRLISLLGAGGMGEVWRAHDPLLDRAVAVKLVRSPERGYLERLAREARALAKLSHPHVVGIFDVGHYSLPGSAVPGVFIVMELVEGTTLAQWMQAPRRTTRELVYAFVQAADGIAAAHEAGLVHRDFKPANVFVGREGRARVGDFGLAQRERRAELQPREIVLEMGAHELVDTMADSLTVSGTVVGTPLYMAPEQHRGDLADPRSDQYAFCVALYEALAGVRPFDGGIEAVHAAKRDRVLAAPRSHRVIPKRLMAVIERGLDPDPAARWPSMRALIAALRPRRSRRGLAVAAAVAMLVPIGVVAVVAPRDAKEACAAQDRIDRAWNPEHRSSVHRAVSAAASAPEADRAIAQLDAYARDLRLAVADHCASPRDGAAGCLRDAATQFVTTVELLASDERAARAARGALAELPGTAHCDDTTGPAASDASGAARLDDAAARARALWSAGLVDEAIAVASAARLDAIAMGAAGRPGAAKLAAEIGRFHDSLGNASLASDGLQEAYYLAREIGDADTATGAAIRLALLSAEHSDQAAAKQWTRHAEAAHAQADLDACDEAEYGSFHALVDAVEGDPGAGVDVLRDILGDCPAEGCSRICITVASNLAALLDQIGRNDEALVGRRDVLDRSLRRTGPDSIEVTAARVELAQSLVTAGDLDAAETELDLAAAVIERVRGFDDPKLASIAVLRSRAAKDRGDLGAALMHARRAATLAENTRSTDDHNFAVYLGTLGNALSDVGDHAGAAAAFARALELEPPGLQRALVLLARSYARLQSVDYPGAAADARDARQLLLRLAPERVDGIVFTFADEAEAHERSGDCDAADRVLAAGVEWAAVAAEDEAAGQLSVSRAELSRRCAAASR